MQVDIENLNKERAVVLLKATYDIIQKCNKSYYVTDVCHETVEYDETECDGLCLKNDIQQVLEDIGFKF